MVTADCNGFDGSAEKLRKFTTIAETGSSVDPLRLISVSAKAPISGPNLGSVKIPLTSANQLRFRDGWITIGPTLPIAAVLYPCLAAAAISVSSPE